MKVRKLGNTTELHHPNVGIKSLAQVDLKIYLELSFDKT